MRRSLLTLFLAVGVAACNEPSASPAPPTAAPKPVAPAPSPATAGADAGKVTYVRLCAPCHGANLAGYAADHAPSLVNPTFLESATDSYLARSIELGRPGTSMAAYGKAMGGPLDPKQIAQLVAFIRGKGAKAKRLAAVAKGDPGRGAGLYTEYCKACHGDATTRGEAIHLANPVFQKLATDSFIRYAIERGRPGTKMMAFGKVLEPGKLDDLVAYVRALDDGSHVEQLLPPPTGKEPLVIHPRGKNPVFKPRDVKYVPADQIAKALAAGKKMIIIDARPPSEWRRVHIKGAVSIPYHDMARLAEVPKNVTVLAYCACPHHLSGIVVDELRKRGHAQAFVIDEGINYWHVKGYPVTAAPGVKPPVNEAMPR